jgi:hypothetical protein
MLKNENDFPPYWEEWYRETAPHVFQSKENRATFVVSAETTWRLLRENLKRRLLVAKKAA